MKILVIAATQMEFQPTVNHFDYLGNNLNLSFHVVGVGMLATAVSLTKLILTQKPDLVIQAGIAGCFNQEIPLGNVVIVKEEILGDLGVEEDGVWKDLFVTKFITPNDNPFTNGRLVNNHLVNYNPLQLPEVTAITVNQITTNKQRIAQLKSLYNPTIESMEGAALHYVCNDLQVPYLQIRAVSNYIGERDKTKWNFIDAIANLNQSLIEIVTNLMRP